MHVKWPISQKKYGPPWAQSLEKTKGKMPLLFAGAAFHTHLASLMRQMGYTSCKADPDLWLKKETSPDNKLKYYSYILCYVDDILCIHHDAMTILNEINGHLPLKPSSVGDPDIYLGAKLRQMRLPKGVWAWGLSPSKYVAQAVKNCANHLTMRLNGRYSIPK